MRWAQYLDADYFLVLYLPVLASTLLAALRRQPFRLSVMAVLGVLAVAMALVALRFSARTLSMTAWAVAAVLVAGQFGCLLIASRAPAFDRHPHAFVIVGPLLFWLVGLGMVAFWWALGLPL